MDYLSFFGLKDGFWLRACFMSYVLVPEYVTIPHGDISRSKESFSLSFWCCVNLNPGMKILCFQWVR